MIVNSCQCSYRPTSASIIHSESSEVNLLLCNVAGSHTCEALGCLCSGNECALHPDYAGKSFILISYSKQKLQQIL